MVSFDSRRIRYSPSRANSMAAAAWPKDSLPSMPSRCMILARPGTSPTLCSRSEADVSSPDSTVWPPSNLASSGDRSALPSRARNVSAMARRSRCASTSSSRPSSLTSNSTLPRRVPTTGGRSHTRATGCSPGGAGGAALGPGGARRVAGQGGPAHGRGGRALGGRDREAGRDAGPGVDRGRLPDQPGEPGDDLDQVLGQLGAGGGAVPADHGLLLDQAELVVQGQRVVGADLGP